MVQVQYSKLSDDSDSVDYCSPSWSWATSASSAASHDILSQRSMVPSSCAMRLMSVPAAWLNKARISPKKGSSHRNIVQQ